MRDQYIVSPNVPYLEDGIPGGCGYGEVYLKFGALFRDPGLYLVTSYSQANKLSYIGLDRM